MLYRDDGIILEFYLNGQDVTGIDGIKRIDRLEEILRLHQQFKTGLTLLLTHKEPNCHTGNPRFTKYYGIGEMHIEDGRLIITEGYEWDWGFDPRTRDLEGVQSGSGIAKPPHHRLIDQKNLEEGVYVVFLPLVE